MPLTIGGKPVATKPATADPLALIGYELIRLVEVARAVGALRERIREWDERLAIMRAWLDANQGHPKWEERNTQWEIERDDRYLTAGERNRLEVEERQRIEAFGRALGNAGPDAVQDVSAALGHPLSGGTVFQLARTGEANPGMSFFGVLDVWARREQEENR